MNTKISTVARTVLCDLAIFILLCLPALSWSQSVLDSDTRRADTYRRSDAMAEGEVQACTVLSVREVVLEASNTAKVAATTAGGLLGAAFANRNSSNYAATALGSVLGGYAGHAVAQHAGRDQAHELLLKCDGRAVTVVQEADGAAVPAKGNQVHLIRLGGRSRVVL